jgi:hypothetical protein
LPKKKKENAKNIQEERAPEKREKRKKDLNMGEESVKPAPSATP